jgi:hypothetical protein
MIALQLAAMVPFGGRTALVVSVALVTLRLVPQVVGILRGGRMSLPAAAAFATLAPLAVVAMGIFAYAGFFQIIVDRFNYDGGSAHARLEMFEIFDYLSFGQILIGANSDLIDAIRQTHGLELGIENPIVRLVLYQGVAVTTFLVVGFILFMIELARRLRPGTAIPFIFFAIISNAYESISNKSTLLAIFVVLMTTMFHRDATTGTFTRTRGSTTAAS